MKIINFNTNYKYNNYLNKTTNPAKLNKSPFKKEAIAFFGNYSDYDYEIQKLKDTNERLEAQISLLRTQIEQNNAAIRKLEILKQEENKFLTKESIKTSLKYAKNCETLRDCKKVLEYFGYNPTVAENGLLTIDFYNQPSKFTFDELGINENDLFKFIGEVKGDVDLDKSNLESLGNLEIIGGDLRCGNSKYVKTPYGMQVYSIEPSKLKDLGKLHTIKGAAYFEKSEVKNLQNLSSIGKTANFKDSKLENLGSLVLVGGMLDISGTNVQDLGNLKFCGVIYHDNPNLDVRNFDAINFDNPVDDEDDEF